MSRSRVMLLVGIAAAVITFDVWFFFGADATEPELTELEDDVLAGDDVAEDVADSVVETPWSVPGSWSRGLRGLPREGSLRADLMRSASPAVRVEAPRSVETATDGAEPVPEPDPTPPPGTPRLSVVLWNRSAQTAVLDGRTVRVGDSIDDFIVAGIEPHELLLRASDGSGAEQRVQLASSRPEQP